MSKIKVLSAEVTVQKLKDTDYISFTDIARSEIVIDRMTILTVDSNVTKLGDFY